MNRKICVLDDSKLCTDCGECNMCDLDPNKVCDNCMKCINSDGAEFRAIHIDGVITREKDKSK
ncbi:MAG: hypothetical protein IJC48_03465 [Clostridia bacterium]|nr:hypothetical protein [Clostridia bacterium]MBQ4157320.1 hypothetical protein [Clostridia bacterium]